MSEEVKERLAALEVRLGNIEQQVEALARVVRGNNASYDKSLVVDVATLSMEIQEVKQKLAKLDERLWYLLSGIIFTIALQILLRLV